MNIKQEYIGISDDRLHHMIGVARKAYEIAIRLDYDEKFARRMFIIGLNHDIGYEFSCKDEEHPDISAEMIKLMYGSLVKGAQDYTAYQAIKQHESCAQNMTPEWIILSMANMLINSKGNEVDVRQRLAEIETQYGRYSDKYINMHKICCKIGLIEE